jgi:predicted ATPase
VLTRFKVQNYKSLEDVEISLMPLMVFVGPNNAGKSNILDCFFFIKQLAEQGRSAVYDRGGFSQLVWNGAIDKEMLIELDAVVSDRNGQKRSVTYRVEITVDPRYPFNYNISRELLRLWNEGEAKRLLEFPVEQGMARVWDEEGKEVGAAGAGSEQLYIGYFRDPIPYPIIGSFARNVMKWSFYNFSPSRMRLPNPAKEEGLPLHIPAQALSDGTLRLLGQLAVVSSPEPPPLACFEEPENCIHPRLLELVVDIFKSASKKTQILMTTHSPYLLDFLRSPENLVIVEKVEGKTHCKTVQDQEGVKEALKTLGLGELWYSGHIGGTP